MKGGGLSHLHTVYYQRTMVWTQLFTFFPHDLDRELHLITSYTLVCNYSVIIGNSKNNANNFGATLNK